MSERPTPLPRSAFRHWSTINTRWLDNDVYGHVNNAQYYAFFDTVVNRYLIESGALDIHHGAQIGLVVETHCNYFAPLVFPQDVQAGLRVAEPGRSSVRYEIGLFAPDQPLAAAQGHFVHVYVDRVSRRPTALAPALQAALAPLRA